MCNGCEEKERERGEGGGEGEGGEHIGRGYIIIKV